MSDLIPTSLPSLRHFTSARVSLPTAGHSIATSEVLNFQLAHAQARDAVHAPFHVQLFAQRVHTELPILAEASIPVLQLRTNAADRATYLRQPVLGRTLHPDSGCPASTRIKRPRHHHCGWALRSGGRAQCHSRARTPFAAVARRRLDFRSTRLGATRQSRNWRPGRLPSWSQSQPRPYWRTSRPLIAG